MSDSTIVVTWRRSAIGFPVDMKATISSLGFRRLNQTRELPDTPQVRGMLRKVGFMLQVDGEPWEPPVRARYKIPRKRSLKKHSRGH